MIPVIPERWLYYFQDFNRFRLCRENPATFLSPVHNHVNHSAAKLGLPFALRLACFCTFVEVLSASACDRKHVGVL